MSTFQSVFPFILWIILLGVVFFYVILSVFVGGNLASRVNKSAAKQANLTSEQRTKLIVSMKKAKCSAYLAKSNLMGVAAILLFILDVLHKGDSVSIFITPNFYFCAFIICCSLAMFDAYQYKQCKKVAQ